ncbi:T9SS type A sorting domain-containing protein, partial [Candidatus Poribacteria bacterium]|nr:T9SS type A sorting domain-containing protein [Candidatus Poribacteria bacterium]
LLANYPNPFNPETWIPYQLAEPAAVTLAIYDMNGQMVRRLAVGYRAAGIYQSRSRAVYWDGRNQFGESVASGLYFYTLTVRTETRGETKVGGFTATRKMLILK